MINPNHISYKDLSARVVEKEGKFIRYIFTNYKCEYDYLMSSGLYEELVQLNLLIPHDELHLNEEEEVYKIILPQQLIFQSYPFEWSYTQWQRAILSFFKINQISLKYGMVLKDATPYNFHIIGSDAIMFDTTSFIFFKDNNKWLAYKQFCQEFLSPIALMHYNGQNWGKLYMAHLRGFPLDFVSRQLPLSSWFNLTVLLHIHLHAKFVGNVSRENKTEKKGFTIEKLNSLINQINDSILSWKGPYLFNNNWQKYYEIDIETKEYIDLKEASIKSWLLSIKPHSVLDLGANTGKFSLIASEFAKIVIAIESDRNCIEEMYKQIIINNICNVFPLIGDLSEPSPSLGMMNLELSSIFGRAKSELVMGLALIHHLYFTNDMSFAQIAELFSKFSSKYLIVEFIPIEDRKVMGLIETKPHRESGYTLESFNSNLFLYFKKIEEITLFPSFRILMLFKVK
jgi:hypothetical protein